MTDKDLKLPKHLRKELKKPMGDLIGSLDEVIIDNEIISVGDKTTELILKSGIQPNICIYDGKIAREDVGVPEIIKEFPAKEIEIENPPGTLRKEVFDVIREVLESGSRFKIKVVGEEDLITLAVIDIAPIGSFVAYGQPDEGLVLIKIDNKVKEKVKRILEEMKNED